MMRQCCLSMVVLILFAALHALSEPGPKPRETHDPSIIPVPKGYVCYYAPDAITVDGKLDEAAWRNIPWSEDFQDIEGAHKPKPRHRTRMKMAWDKHGLYIAAELDEPHLQGTLKNHDAVIFQDNDFEVFLDPDGDSHLYAELEMNALNTTWDLLLSRPYKDAGRAINAWEITGLRTAVQLHGTLNDPRDTDQGWTLEIFWPWEGLKELCPGKFVFPPRDGDRWRINFSRVEWDFTVEDGKYVKVPRRPEHNWVWSPQGVIDMHRPERWGIVHFSTAAVGSATFIPDPAQPARDFLYRVYYLQHDHHKRVQRFVPRLELLNVNAPSPLSNAKLETHSKGFNVSVDITLPDGTKQTWRVDQYAQLHRE